MLTIWEFKILFDIENTGTVIGYSDMSNETAVLFGSVHLDNGEINIEALLYILRIPRGEDEMKELTIRVNQINKLGIFKDLNCVRRFYALARKSNEFDAKAFALNFLLVNILEDTDKYIDLDYRTRFDVLTIYAKMYKKDYISEFLEMIDSLEVNLISFFHFDLVDNDEPDTDYALQDELRHLKLLLILILIGEYSYMSIMRKIKTIVIECKRYGYTGNNLWIIFENEEDYNQALSSIETIEAAYQGESIERIHYDSRIDEKVLGKIYELPIEENRIVELRVREMLCVGISTDSNEAIVNSVIAIKKAKRLF